MSRWLSILLSIVLYSLCVEAQTITLSDTLFAMPNNTEDVVTLPTERPRFTIDGALFEVAPAVKVEDYLTAPDYSHSFFDYFPELPSEFFLHVLVLHLSKVKIPGLEADLARYNIMLENFNRNLYEGGGYKVPYVPAIVGDTHSSTFVTAGGGIVVYSGCLDPLEAYRRWEQERRLLRARKIINFLEDDTPSAIQRDAADNMPISPNLFNMPDDNYDVKVKKDGDNPPYRP
ncbi:MAG: hypothetical protein E7084_07335 [Bacteroidales bacterium]|nr:hypothetical protein [Bacteroidales bacterium]